MLLLGEQLARYCEQSDKLLANVFCFAKAFGEESDLSNDTAVRLRHHNWSEQLLQIVGQLLSATVALASRVHGDKDA